MVVDLSNGCRSSLATATSLTMRRWVKSFSFKVIKGSRLQTSSPKKAFPGTLSSYMGSKYGIREPSRTAWFCYLSSSAQFLLFILVVTLSCLSYESVFRQCINTSTLVVDTNIADRCFVSNHSNFLILHKMTHCITEVATYWDCASWQGAIARPR